MDADRIANDPEAWLSHYLAAFEATPADGMDKGLAFAILGRIDAHGRDARTGKLYAADTLRAAFAVLTRHHQG